MTDRTSTDAGFGLDQPWDAPGAGGALRRVVALAAGTSQPSTTHMLASRLAQATVIALREQDVPAELTTIDLRELAHDTLGAMLTGVRSEALEDAMETVAGADGIVLTTPVYSGSYSGLLKMFLDVLDPGSIDGVPVLLSATGGTPRHSLAIDHALRPLMAYLRAIPVATGVYAATDDWASADAEQGEGGDLPGRIARAGGELAAAIGARAPRVRVDEFAGTPDFAQMLRSV